MVDPRRPEELPALGALRREAVRRVRRRGTPPRTASCLGESIADLGGVAIAHRAFVKSLEGKPAPAPIDGLTADQRFFLSWARIWATNDRPEFAKLIVNTNPHPLGRFRAIAPASNLPVFARAFSCKPGDPMVRAEVCEIW
jgi:predicted metalloendopeptidase